MRRDPSIVRHSFVVRVWREKGESSWRGWVQHARSGESMPVRNRDELWAFIERMIEQWGDKRPAGLK